MEHQETGTWGGFAALQAAGLSCRSGPVREFFAMLVAAIGAGFLVSLSVAAIALALAGSAQAASLAGMQREALFNPAAATTTWIGDGCESLALVPLERDWHVRINAHGVSVRAMTTYRVPGEYDGAVLVSGALPPGGRLQSLLLQGERREFAPRMLAVGTGVAPGIGAGAMDPHAYATDPVIGLQAGEAFVVTLRFELRLQAAERLASLQFTGDRAQAASLAIGAPGFDVSEGTPSALRESVWVEWSANLPVAITGAPPMAEFEHAQGRVDAVNWSGFQPGPGPIRLVLAY